MDADPIIWRKRQPSAETIYIYSSSTTICELVPRKWWQFWKPRLVEQWTTWTGEWTDDEKEQGTNA